MILKKTSNELILVDEETIFDNNIEIEDFITLNPEYIYVEELPFHLGKIFVYEDEANGIIVPEAENELKELKQLKMIDVQNIFDRMFSQGVFTSSLGFRVDNRRSGGKNDKDNVQSLIDMNQEPVYFKSADDTFEVLTLEQLNTLKLEMIQDGLNKYQWKWQKQQEIMEATDMSTLESIVIEEYT